MKNRNGRRATQFIGFGFRSPPPSPTSLIHVALKQQQDESSEVGVQLSKLDRHQDFATPGGVTYELLCCKPEVDSSSDNQCLRNEEVCGGGRSGCDSNVTKLDTEVLKGHFDGARPSSGVVQLEKMGDDSCSLPENSALAEVSAEVKSEISEQSNCDHLDQISLKERQRMLLSRKHCRSENSISESIPVAFSEDVMQKLSDQENDGTSIVGKAVMPPGSNALDLCRSMITLPQQNVAVPAFTSTASPFSFHLAKSNYHRRNSESDRECCSDRVCPVAMKLSPCEEQDDEPRGTSRANSSVKIKDEPLENSDLSSHSRCVKGDFSLKMLSVKQEQRGPDEFSEEEIDNMLLRDRMNLLVSQKDSEASFSRNFGHLFETFPSAVNCIPNSTEGAKSVSISRPKKRKKTATDCVQTALEEDAPELLQVLVDKGVLLDEIKLYGMIKIDEALDESFCEDGFSQLEAVISKLFSQRQSFIKLAPLRCTNDSRPSYCLASLFSLVEQARYLQFRNWPVEWGWCRDLQSFIFVFARHNRIVLERPEYGYAAYFFELVHSLPIEWQIKRLVTAMKLTSCDRLSLIENKTLMVGEDLSKGEAQVLMEYGWC